MCDGKKNIEDIIFTQVDPDPIPQKNRIRIHTGFGFRDVIPRSARLLSLRQTTRKIPEHAWMRRIYRERLYLDER